MSDNPRLSALVYAPSGYGKSWLGSTVPPPRLIIDLEGRARYTPNGSKAVSWDGSSDPMSLPKSETRTYVLTVTDMAVLDPALQWLQSGKHPWKSVDVDSLMFAQMRTAQQIRPNASDSLQTQDWGVLLRKMERFVQGLHDMTLQAEEIQPLRCVVFLAGSTDKDGVQRPLMQGQIAGKLPYLVDLAGYLDNSRNDDGELVRQLIVEPWPMRGIQAVKDGTHTIKSKFGGVIEDPDFGSMYEAIVQKDQA
jgi:hypothetical protein